MTTQRFRVGLLATHPIQYYAPWYRLLAEQVDLTVFYCQRLTPHEQASGFGGAFEWDVPLLEGYQYRFLSNQAREPNVSTFFGCDTPEIGQIVTQEKFDAFIVHGWAVKSFWQAIHACWRTGTPVLVRGDSHLLTTRGRGRRAIKYPLYRWFIPRFNGYLVVGERVRQYLRYYGANPEHMFFVPHAVDNDFFARHARASRAMREQVRQAWGIPRNAVVYLYAGKCIVEKRPLDFVRAVAEAARVQPHVWGLVVGDGHLRAQMQTTAETRGWPVRFIGFLNQTEMPRAYSASDVLVLPSESETWGLVVNEAMACGLPALVSDRVGCAPDLILPAQTGDLFSCGNHSELSALMSAYAANPEQLVRLGESARSHIQRYSLASAVEGTLAAVRAVRDSGRSPRQWSDASETSARGVSDG